jgi:hypothetical protein
MPQIEIRRQTVKGDQAIVSAGRDMSISPSGGSARRGAMPRAKQSSSPLKTIGAVATTVTGCAKLAEVLKHLFA